MMPGRGATLRFPYSFSTVNSGDLSTTVVNTGDLSFTAVNDGALRLTIYNPKINDTLYAGGGKVADMTVYEDDYGYDLQFTVLDVNSNAFNLTGATVKFQMAKPSSTALKVNGTCTLVTPSAGTCAYTTTSGDFDTLGDYVAQLLITVSGKQYTIGDLNVYVKKQFPLV